MPALIDALPIWPARLVMIDEAPNVLRFVFLVPSIARSGRFAYH